MISEHVVVHMWETFLCSYSLFINYGKINQWVNPVIENKVNKLHVASDDEVMKNHMVDFIYCIYLGHFMGFLHIMLLKNWTNLWLEIFPLGNTFFTYYQSTQIYLNWYAAQAKQQNQVTKRTVIQIKYDFIMYPSQLLFTSLVQ